MSEGSFSRPGRYQFRPMSSEMGPGKEGRLMCVSKQWSCGTFTDGAQFVEKEAEEVLLDSEQQELERQIEECSITYLLLTHQSLYQPFTL